MLEELHVPYEHVLAKPWSKAAKQYNPQGKVPILVVDGGDFVLSESAAINTYLATKYASGSNHLVPPPTSSLEQLARYHQLTLTIMIDMDALGLWIYDKHQVLHKYFGKSPEAVQEAKRQFDAVQAVLVSQLEKQDNGGPYLMGSDFSAVDILYVHCLDWAKNIGWLAIHPDENKNENDDVLGAYLQKCHSRPAYQRTLAKRQAEEAQAEKERKQQAVSKL
jgi:glutathione S-transferase